MSQSKTTRAFRTISEAGEELGLQPHVLRFWESKFSQIKPIKRGGGRRFYRPEDIEFIRGIKKLLHDEKHPIKDVQKLIQKKGANRIVELGRSLEKASKDRPVAETDLLPKRIKSVDASLKPRIIPRPRKPKPVAPTVVQNPTTPTPQPVTVQDAPVQHDVSDQQALRDALESLKGVKSRLAAFREDRDSV